jgi:CHRD domain-containing protein/PEP-CTERM motif-containing protein
MNRLLLTGLVVTACLAAQRANAEIQFMAIIENEQEVSNPPIPEQGSGGIGFFILNDAQNALSYDVTLTGLDLDGLQTPNNPNDNVTRTHFHAAPAGQNGGIVFGQIDPNHDLDDRVLNPVTGRITGVWDGNEGNGTTLAAQLANLLAGNLYFNVHTSDHAGGEIRGQVLIVPEPGTWLLGILGCALGYLVWRRRRS